MLGIKRVYERKEANDGVRILVDRLWPRGLRSTEANIDEWAKELAPGDELRRWFAHKLERWLEFRQRYRQELSSPGQVELLRRIARIAAGGNVTLVYAARDSEHNNARVLEKLITELMKDSPKPETGRKGAQNI